MQDDKAELLRSLEIDRSAPPVSRGQGRSLTMAMVAGAALTAVVGLLWLRPWDAAAVTTASSSGTPPVASAPASTTAAATPPSSSGAAAAPAASPPPRSAGLVASGYVVARRVATVSAQITGKVTEVMVEEGLVVKQGQVLAQLDATVAKIDLRAAEAQVAVAEAGIDSVAADLRDAERTLVRVQSLNKNDFASEADRIRALARAESLRAQLVRSKASLEAARIAVAAAAEQVARHSVRAPFSGIVTQKNAQPGEIISPLSSGGFTRTGVCTIVDMDSLEVEVDVNEANIGRVFPNQRVEAVLDAYQDWKIPGYVIAVIPTANRDKATIKVRIGLRARDARVLPEMAAKVTFFDKETDPATRAG